MISFAVRGDPITQGSKSAFPVRRKGAGGEWEYTGQINLREGRRPKSAERFKTWRAAVKDAAIEAMNDIDFDFGTPPGPPSGLWPMEGPLIARMVFSLPRPKGHYLPVNRKRSVPELRAAAPSHPDGKPDLMKLVRAVEDAIKLAGMYRDDAQIVEYSRVAKVYINSDFEAMPFPGVIVQVGELPVASPLPRRKEEEGRLL